MPALLAAPWFIPLITAAGAGGSLAATGYQLANSPSTPKAATTNTAATQAALAAQQKAALLSQQGNTQEQTGGSLTAGGFNATSAKAAGVPSDLNSLMQSLGGGSSNVPISGGTTTPNSSTSSDPNSLQNLSDLLKAA